MPVATDTAHESAECSNGGMCNRGDGTCTCRTGFEGQACNRKTCAKNCNGHGRCVSMRRHAATKPVEAHDDTTFKYETNWDADMMYGCECDAGYSGFDCSLRTCPTGDDPMTKNVGTTDVEQQDEVQIFKCTATQGHFTLQFKGKQSAPIAHDAKLEDVKKALNALDTIRGVAVTFSFSAGPVCVAAGGSCSDPQHATAELCGAAAGATWQAENIVAVTFQYDYGDLPPLLWPTSAFDDCSASNINLDVHLCGGESGNPAGIVFGFDGGKLGDVESNVGTKEESECAGRGLCDDQIGTCTCYPGYVTSDGRGNAGTRGDCGHKLTSITACPGEVACSAHGVCKGTPTFKCECARGWRGGDCALRECPQGPAWFSYPSAGETAHGRAECSNVGICDRTTGECTCDESYTGAACEYLQCPGGGTCSGHGRCLSMRQLAEAARENGEAVTRSYGTTRPNDNVNWDKDSVYGCHCDEGYEGFDCSLRSCPTGDDIETPNEANVDPQQHEEQTVKCAAEEGYMTFQFRDSVAAAELPFDATAAQAKAHFESISTIDGVDVIFADGVTTFCSPGNGDDAVTIVFRGNLGDVPLLKLHDSSPSVVIQPPDNENDGSNVDELVMVREDNAEQTVLFVKESKTGTYENEECGNRGTCDYTTGLCTCFTGYGSSDGSGRMGNRGDCGHKLPVFSTSS